MHDWLDPVVLVWLSSLMGVMVVYAVSTRRLVHRILILEALTTVAVAALGVLAIEGDEAGYLDVAVALALLGFVQTVAMVRLIEKRRERG